MSDDYTPTTAEVRRAYEDKHCKDPDDPAHSLRMGCPIGVEFDRWLAAHDAEKDARIAELESRLRADIDLMNIAGIDGPGADRALAAHDAEVRADQREKDALPIDDDYQHIYWRDPVEGCWVAYRRADCVGDEELPVGRTLDAIRAGGVDTSGSSEEEK